MGSTQHGSNPGSTATRAVALVGPAGTAKTRLDAALLFASGAINRQGSVEAGNSVGDASPEARARGGSTEINLFNFDYLGDRYALIDLPGGTGFAVDGLAALQSADLALVVIDPAPERAVLADYGNMSAPTVFFVLERALATGLPKRTLMTAMGPGFSAATVTLLAA